ncbi:MAG: Ribosomal RNA small subunit methyltransferase A [Chlamydiia bacterium]|nr:Ribosomal RNA small subunit methyltransferase A [Chlamydiia bacterium]MCH9616535.1 Ribosomal RNA small subunit methyltransferase A [Chlamydiia bacterium]MCH9629265.1 Ribosomal RNA small subunit methyltransferase A [Chlamydiia bacterium]
MYKLSEVSQQTVCPIKALSQNFLIDLNVIKKTIDTLGDIEGKRVLEIGPGLGALSEEIIKRGGILTAIEKDARLIPFLKEELPTATIIEGDAMEVDLPEIDLIISNLPYQLTSPFLGRLLPLNLPMTLFMQEEVARRVVGKQGTKDYSALTLFANYYACPSFAFTISPKCFYPRPKIDSAIVTFIPKNKKPFPAFHTAVRQAFNHRRKMLRHSFSETLLTSLGIDPTARPENISLEAFLELGESLQKETEQQSP